MSSESSWHISSLIVHVMRESWQKVLAYIQQLPATEIPVTEETSGKCIAVLERDTLRATEETIEAIKAQPGVIAVTLVYHHSETVEALNEPLAANAN